jgi:hypothetical protein
MQENHSGPRHAFPGTGINANLTDNEEAGMPSGE